MASALSRSVGKLRLSVAAAGAYPFIAGSSYTTTRSLSASIQGLDEDKSQRPDSSSSSTTSTTRKQVQPDESGRYNPPAKSAGAWPLDAKDQSAHSTSDATPSSSTSSESNPYKGLFDGSDPFPTVTVPKLGASSSSLGPSPSDKPSWLSDQLDSLTTPRRPRASAPDQRKKHSIPRSVLFANSETARQSDDFRPRKTNTTPSRKRFDRSPLTQQEANAFMSLLNSALAGTSTTTTASATAEESEQTPFGSYTSLISNPKTQSGSQALLQAFAKRNRLKRFEEARAQRAKRFVREGLAAQIDPVQLEAGIDEAREQIAMCENLAELLEWTKREVWGLRGGANAEQLEGMLSGDGTKYGKETAYYSSVLLLVFLAARDRYRSPHTALAIAKTTRSLGIESYVLGVTGSLYNEVLKTQWDWLGDLRGVVSTLRQARETGILSAPLKSGAPAKYSTFVNTEDDTIRETVDRIANDVRKYVLDQQMSTDAAFKNNYLYGSAAETDVLSAAEGRRTEKGVQRDWSLNWLLANAEEATNLAGQPHRLMLEKKSRESQAGRGRFSGDRADRKPFDDRRSDSRPPSRYNSAPFDSRSSSRSWA